MHDCLAMRSRGTTLATHFVFTVMPFAWAVPEKTLHALFVVRSLESAACCSGKHVVHGMLFACMGAG
jgi:hypothetical protein